MQSTKGDMLVKQHSPCSYKFLNPLWWTYNTLSSIPTPFCQSIELQVPFVHLHHVASFKICSRLLSLEINIDKCITCMNILCNWSCEATECLMAIWGDADIVLPFIKNSRNVTSKLGLKMVIFSHSTSYVIHLSVQPFLFNQMTG